MPDHAIREQLRTNNVRYDGPSMPTTFENGEAEAEAEAEAESEDRDPWRDSPYQSPSNSFNAGRRMRTLDSRMRAPAAGAAPTSQIPTATNPPSPSLLGVSSAHNSGTDI